MTLEEMNLEQVWPLVRSQGKLDRDRGLSRLEELLQKGGQPGQPDLQDRVLGQLLDDAQHLEEAGNWERKLGFFQAAKVFYAHLGSQ